METVNVNGKSREMRVEKASAGDAQRADLIRRGWDGDVFFCYGPRGAAKIAYRNAKTGMLHAV